MEPVITSLPRGIVAVALILVFSLVVSTAFSPDTLTGWASLVLVAMVPTQVVVGLFWGGAYPRGIATLTPPLRGLAYLVITMIIASIVIFFVITVIGGGVTPPTPFVIMFLILSVPVTVTLVVILQGWPFSGLFKSPGTQGIALLVTAYAITFLLFHTLFNFSFAQQAPFWQAALDPAGVFPAWYPLAASLDALVFILVLVLFDFWPISALARAVPLFSKQPLFGLAAAVLVAVCSALLWWLCVLMAQMDIVVFMTRVCVAMVFGIFIILVMLEGASMLRLAQPLRGIVLTIVAVVLAQVMLVLYSDIAEQLFHLPAGQPTYALEMWLASSMLSVTFPAMVFFAQYFLFWPFVVRQKGK